MHIPKIILVSLVALVSSSVADDEDYRLPYNYILDHYDIDLVIPAESFTEASSNYSGSVVINFQVSKTYLTKKNAMKLASCEDQRRVVRFGTRKAIYNAIGPLVFVCKFVYNAGETGTLWHFPNAIVFGAYSYILKIFFGFSASKMCFFLKKTNCRTSCTHYRLKCSYHAIWATTLSKGNQQLSWPILHSPLKNLFFQRDQTRTAIFNHR